MFNFIFNKNYLFSTVKEAETTREGGFAAWLITVLENPSPTVTSCFFFRVTFAAKKEFAKAVEWCSKSLTASKQIGALDDELNACDCLYQAYKGMGQSGKALAWHERFVLLNDSLQKAETERGWSKWSLPSR